MFDLEEAATIRYVGVFKQHSNSAHLPHATCLSEPTDRSKDATDGVFFTLIFIFFFLSFLYNWERKKGQCAVVLYLSLSPFSCSIVSFFLSIKAPTLWLKTSAPAVQQQQQQLPAATAAAQNVAQQPGRHQSALQRD